MRIERLRQEHGVQVRWVHFPLHPETPAEGRSLKDLFAGRDYDIEARQREMRARMEAEGLPYGNRTMTYNSRLAQELGKWADSLPAAQPGGSKIHDALFKAYFVDGRNIGDEEELIRIAESVALDAKTAREVIEKRTFKDAIDQDWAKSRGYGITGVPTFVASGYGLVGAQPYEALEQFVTQVRQKA